MARFNYRQISTDAPAAREPPLARWLADRPQMPYLIPIFAYVALMLPGQFGHFAGIDWNALWMHWHPFIYATQSLLAALLLWYFWPHYTPIRWAHRAWGIAAGLFGTLLWIGSYKACLAAGISHQPDPSTLYNPDLQLHAQWQRWAYLCVRVAGPTLVVPFMEELFFRDFLMRAFILGARFQEVAIGTFTWLSLLATSAIFAVNHGVNMLVPGFLYGLLMGILLIRTKSLGACIIAHGLTNLTLYLYVIYTGDWQFM